MKIQDIFEYVVHVVLRNLPNNHRIYRGKNTKSGLKVVGITRVRNEETLMHDSLSHLASFVDGIIVYDDASTDNTRQIALSHPAVIEVIENKRWRSSHRGWEETANRQMLLDRAKRHRPKWIYYADADERFEGQIKEFLLSSESDNVDGIRISLLDAYMTLSDQAPYDGARPLVNFRKQFGPERRDILMIWRNGAAVRFWKIDSREPGGIAADKIITKFFCQHYGKALSIEQWEMTCDYYIANFPGYSEKWKARKGKALHTKSDFDTKLFSWDEAKANSVKIN